MAIRDFQLITDLGSYEPWGGAIETYKRIVDNDLVDELDMLMAELHPDGLEVGAFNDILWFEDEWLFETLGLEDSSDQEDE
jgi:hypothetical protein